MKTVYLAGPMTGVPKRRALAWRQDAAGRIETLCGARVRCVSPLRGLSVLLELESDQLLPAHAGSRIHQCDRDIVHADELDVRNCSVLLVNLQGATAVSVGTVCEIGLARGLGKPIILVVDDVESYAQNPHSHIFLEAWATFQYDDLNQACEMTARVIEGMP